MPRVIPLFAASCQNVTLCHDNPMSLTVDLHNKAQGSEGQPRHIEVRWEGVTSPGKDSGPFVISRYNTLINGNIEEDMGALNMTK